MMKLALARFFFLSATLLGFFFSILFFFGTLSFTFDYFFSQKYTSEVTGIVTKEKFHSCWNEVTYEANGEFYLVYDLGCKNIGEGVTVRYNPKISLDSTTFSNNELLGLIFFNFSGCVFVYGVTHKLAAKFRRLVGELPGES